MGLGPSFAHGVEPTAEDMLRRQPLLTQGANIAEYQ